MINKDVKGAFGRKAMLSVLIILVFAFSFVLCCCEDEEFTPIVFDGDKSIISDVLPSSTAVYSVLPIRSCYGRCNEYKFPVEAKITDPSGNVTVTDDNYLVKQQGLYTVELSCNIGVETITKTVYCEASAGEYSEDYLFSLQNAEKLASRFSASENVHTDYSQGTLFNLTSSGSIRFNNVIDLNKVIGNLVEIIPNAGDSTDLFSLNLRNFRVRLTDVYDSSNSVSVYYWVNDPYRTKDFYLANQTLLCSFVQVEFNGVATAYANYAPLPNQYTAHLQSFLPQLFAETSQTVFVPMYFSFDNETNRFFSGYNSSTYSVGTQELIADIDDPTDSFSDFRGFTTGEVYVTIEGVSSNGSLLLTKLGNYTFDNVTKEYYEDEASGLLARGYNFDNMYDGAVNYPYPMPQFAGDVKVKLYYKNNAEYIDVTEQIVDGVFVPQVTGEYAMECVSSNAYGYKQQTTGYFTVNEQPVEITEVEAPQLNAKLMETFVIPKYSYQGGTGELTVKYTFNKNGVFTQVKEGDGVLLDKKGEECQLFVDVTDVIGYSKRFSYDIQVDENVRTFALVDAFDIMYVAAGKTLMIPDYVAVDYSRDVEYDVQGNPLTNINNVDITFGSQVVDVGDEVTVYNDGEIVYKIGGAVQKKVSVYCVPSKIDNTANYSIAKQFRSAVNTNISTNGVGTMFTAKQNGKLSFDMPYEVSASELLLSFAVFETKFHYESVKVTVTAVNGAQLVYELKDLGAKPTLWINGQETTYQITTTSKKYTMGDNGALANLRYYIYTFVVDGSAGNLCNESMLKLTKIDKWIDGLDFDGFKCGSARVSFEIPNALQGDTFELIKVANQGFTTAHFEYGEKMAPAIAFESEMRRNYVEYGQTVKIPKAYAYDVLSDNASVKMTVIAPDGTRILNNKPAQAYSLEIDSYGKYSVYYDLEDVNYNNQRVFFTFEVIDNVAPTLKVNGEYKEHYSKLIGVTVLNATASDNNGTATITCWLRYDDMSTIPVSMGQTIKEKGRYTLVYYATDEAGNVSTKEYSFEVR